MMRIRTAEPGDRSRWDDYVFSHESSGPYHAFAWQDAVENGYGHRALSLLAEDEHSEILGVLPLISVRIPFLKETLVSQPFCDYGGALADTREVRDALFDHAMRLAALHGAALEIRCKEPDPLPAAASSLCASADKSRMLLDIPESSELLWNGFKSKLRSQVRKAQKEGLVFELGGREWLDAFYRIFCESMRLLGSPVHSRKWFEALFDAYQEKVLAGVVLLGGEPVASGIILCHGGTVTIPWASTRREFNALSPNMLLYWGFLQYAGDHGFHRFDFGRSTPGEGTYRFKEQWGARPFPLYWYGKVTGSGHRLDPTSGRLRERVARLWAGLPLPVVNVLGPVLRRYITL